MKKTILIIATFIVTVILDEKYNLLETYVKNKDLISAIKVLGTLVLGYLTPKKLGITNEFNK